MDTNGHITYRLLPPDEYDGEAAARFPDGLQRSLDHHSRGIISPHGVGDNGYVIFLEAQGNGQPGG